MSFKSEEIDKIILDEIYTFYHHLYLKDKKGNKIKGKRNRAYLFNALVVLKNGKKFPFFKLYNKLGESSLIDFLEHLPFCKNIFADGATMYQNCWFRKIISKKSKETNIIESFNFYCRNFNSCLTRKSLCYAKTIDYFNHRMIEVVRRWLDSFNLNYFLKINTI